MRNPGQDGYDSAAVRRIYQDMAAGYADRFGAEFLRPDSDTRFLDAALADLPDGPVLDVGCGPAQVSRYLLGLGRRPVGIDFAPGMLAAAARLVPQARLVAADLLELPFRRASCAGAVASYSLHHLPGPRLDAALAGLRATLMPGGVLVIITHGSGGESGSGEERLRQFEGNVVLCRHSAQDLAARLACLGLVVAQASSRPPRPGEFPADKVRISARAPA